jgi:N-acetylmuramoyl-L-alanine amidase
MSGAIKLCIDPGHGASNQKSGVYDPGAQDDGFSEADIVLQWALTGKWVCQQNGIAVFLTRDDDRDPDPVGLRDDKAEAAGCTHFLALHCNEGNGLASGTETYYRDDADKVWAHYVQMAALAAMKSKDRGLKTESDSQHTRLAVFDFDGPAALLEIGFIDNIAEREKLLSRETRLIFWQALLHQLGDTGAARTGG